MVLRPGAINKRVVDTSKHGAGFLEDNEKIRVTIGGKAVDAMEFWAKVNVGQ